MSAGRCPTGWRRRGPIVYSALSYTLNLILERRQRGAAPLNQTILLLADTQVQISLWTFSNFFLRGWFRSLFIWDKLLPFKMINDSTLPRTNISLHRDLNYMLLHCAWKFVSTPVISDSGTIWTCWFKDISKADVRANSIRYLNYFFFRLVNRRLPATTSCSVKVIKLEISYCILCSNCGFFFWKLKYTIWAGIMPMFLIIY